MTRSALSADGSELGELLAPTADAQGRWLGELEASGAFDGAEWADDELLAVRELTSRFEAQRLSGRWCSAAERQPRRPSLLFPPFPSS